MEVYKKKKGGTVYKLLFQNMFCFLSLLDILYKNYINDQKEINNFLF